MTEDQITRPGGRPSLLDEATRQGLLDTLKLGVPMRSAAAAVGIHVNTLGNWMKRGYIEHEARSNDKPADEAETPYLELYLEAQKARSEAVVRGVALVQKAAQGGYVTKVTTKKYKDVETGVIVTETAEDIASPDWRASAWFLERTQPEEFGKEAQKVELSGPGGGAVQIGGQDAEDLANRLAAHLAANTAIAAIGGSRSDDDASTDQAIVDAEFTEEG